MKKSKVTVALLMAFLMGTQNLGSNVVNAGLYENVGALVDKYKSKPGLSNDASSLQKFYMQLNAGKISQNEILPSFSNLKNRKIIDQLLSNLIDQFDKVVGFNSPLRFVKRSHVCLYAYIAQNWDVYQYLFKNLIVKHDRKAGYSFITFCFSQEDIDNCESLQGKFEAEKIYTISFYRVNHNYIIVNQTLGNEQKKEEDSDQHQNEDCIPELLKIENLLN